jgi:hypothetical protein
MNAWLSRSGILVGVWLLLVAVLPAEATAGITWFTDRAAFEASGTDLASITFENIAAPNDFADVSGGLTLKGVSFSPDSSSSLYVIDPAYTPEFYDWGSGAVLSAQSANGGAAGINVTLPAGTTEFGSDIMTFLPYATPVIVTLVTGETFTAPTDDFPTRAFVGFISTTPISSLTFGASTNLNLDNVLVGPQAVPEPSSGLLLVTGAGGMAVLVLLGKTTKRKNRCRVSSGAAISLP